MLVALKDYILSNPYQLHHIKGALYDLGKKDEELLKDIETQIEQAFERARNASSLSLAFDKEKGFEAVLDTVTPLSRKVFESACQIQALHEDRMPVPMEKFEALHNAIRTAAETMADRPISMAFKQESFEGMRNYRLWTDITLKQEKGLPPEHFTASMESVIYEGWIASRNSSGKLAIRIMPDPDGWATISDETLEYLIIGLNEYYFQPGDDNDLLSCALAHMGLEKEQIDYLMENPDAVISFAQLDWSGLLDVANEAKEKRLHEQTTKNASLNAPSMGF